MPDDDFPAWLETEWMEDEDTGITIRPMIVTTITEHVWDLPGYEHLKPEEGA